MKMQSRRVLSPIGHQRMTLNLLAALLFVGLSAPAHAQQTPSDPPAHDKKTANPPAPPADASPRGDPTTGVLKPPDVDPKMAKPVPDVDPAMINPPPGKPVAPDPSAPLKIQPR